VTLTLFRTYEAADNLASTVLRDGILEELPEYNILKVFARDFRRETLRELRK